MTVTDHIPQNTIFDRVEIVKTENHLKGSQLRKVKQLLTKFNNFHDNHFNRFNKYERHKYKLLYDYELNQLKTRFEVIDDIYRNLHLIERMGYTLYYHIDDDNPTNNDFIFGLNCGAIRGLKVVEPFKYEKYLYETLTDHKKIYRLAEDNEKKMYEKVRQKSEDGLKRWANGDDPPTKKADEKFNICGFNFTADEYSKDIILQYMANKKGLT